VFVTHGIQKAVVRGSRCAVLNASPTRMADYCAIGLPYPRQLDLKTTDKFVEYDRRIHHLLGVEWPGSTVAGRLSPAGPTAPR
jgi:NitT/TauT family transport system ATP-binding protein